MPTRRIETSTYLSHGTSVTAIARHARTRRSLRYTRHTEGASRSFRRGHRVSQRGTIFVTPTSPPSVGLCPRRNYLLSHGPLRALRDHRQLAATEAIPHRGHVDLEASAVAPTARRPDDSWDRSIAC